MDSARTPSPLNGVTVSTPFFYVSGYMEICKFTNLIIIFLKRFLSILEFQTFRMRKRDRHKSFSVILTFNLLNHNNMAKLVTNIVYFIHIFTFLFIFTYIMLSLCMSLIYFVILLGQHVTLHWASWGLSILSGGNNLAIVQITSPCPIYNNMSGGEGHIVLLRVKGENKCYIILSSNRSTFYLQ